MRKKKYMLTNENAQKKQYCEDEEAFELYDNFEKFEYDITSKEIQTTPDQKYWGTNRHHLSGKIYLV